MEKFRAKGELPGDITLKIRRTVQRAPGGKQQMLMFGEINHRAEVERGVRAPAGGQRGAMIDFRAEQDLFRDLPLHHHAAVAIVFVARAGIEAVTAATVNRPVAKTL